MVKQSGETRTQGEAVKEEDEMVRGKQSGETRTQGRNSDKRGRSRERQNKAVRQLSS